MKYLFFFWAFVSGWFSLEAQDSISQYKKQEIRSSHIVVLAGPNYLVPRGIVNFDPSIVLHKINKTGFSFGVGLVQQLNRRFELDLLILWERKKYQVNQDWYHLYDSLGLPAPVLWGTNKYTVANDYVTLSVVPHYTDKRVKAGVGIYVGELVKSQTLGEYFLTQPALINSRGQYSSIDYGLVMSVGYTLPLKNLSIVIELNDHFGLKGVPTRSNLVVQPALQQQSPYPWYNNSISILMGISLHKLNNKIRLL